MFDRKKLQAQMVLKGINGSDLAKKIGISESTLYRKMGNNGDFSRKEIAKIISILEIENPEDIFFADELA